MAITECMLTTVDNPFDPFEQFDDWFNYDAEKGYYSCSRLARLLEQSQKLSDDLSEQEENEIIERVIDEFIELDCFDLYKKVKNNMEQPIQSDHAH